MTTTDLIMEEIRRLRAELPGLIRNEIRKELRSDRMIFKADAVTGTIKGIPIRSRKTK